MIASRTSVVPASLSGERFDLAAASLFPEISRKKIKSILDAGGAYLNKRRVSLAKKQVSTGDVVEIFWEERGVIGAPAASGAGTTAWNQKLEGCVLFEHPGFFVVNKPAGIPSQATLISSTDTILHALHAWKPTKFKLNEMFLVHRLDKDTSGIMLIARSTRWRESLEEMFRERTIRKEYDALCFGIPKQSQGEIKLAIGKDSSRKNTYQPIYGGGPLGQGAKPAQTTYEVAEKFLKADASLIRCFPKTGRTHQIRVHLMAIGTPILGDKTYAMNLPGHALSQIALRQMLHARKISLVIEGKKMEWEAPWPSDFLECLTAVRRIEKME